MDLRIPISTWRHLLVPFAVLLGANISLICAQSTKPKAEPSRTVAEPFTPPAWRRPVTTHADKALIGQQKHTTWIRDKNRNFIDDSIERQFVRPDQLVDIIVELNRAMPRDEVRNLLEKFGEIEYIGYAVSFVVVNRVAVRELPNIARRPEVAMVEWRSTLRLVVDVSTRAIQARSSTTYPASAHGVGFMGTGVVVAIVDSGVDENHESLLGKFVGGVDAFTLTAGGPIPTTDANPDDVAGHGTHVAGIAIGRGSMTAGCSSPASDPLNPESKCVGVAPDASLVDVRVCDMTGACPRLAHGLDWLAVNAGRLGVRVANVSIAEVAELVEDGTGVLAQQVNFLAANGVFVAVAHGNADQLGQMPGAAFTAAPGSASLAATVAATFDFETVCRLPDEPFNQHLTGPRVDFTLASPELAALKPDISAPGQGIVSARSGTTNGYFPLNGTSMAAPHVAGAAALVIQAKPNISVDSLKALLKQTADSSMTSFSAFFDPVLYPALPRWSSSMGSGIVNVHGAVSAVATGDVKFPSCVPGAAAGYPCQLSTLPAWSNSLDLTTATDPQAGVPNTVTARVQNTGSTEAKVLVNFGVYKFGVGNSVFYHIGTKEVTIPADGVLSVDQPWTPEDASHQCLQVSLTYALDSDFTNNITQRNLTVTSASVLRFRVENAFLSDAKFRLEIRSSRADWRCEVTETEFDLGVDVRSRELQVRLTQPKTAKTGEHVDCHIGVWARPRGESAETLVGGVTVRSFIPMPCAIVGSVSDRQGRPVSGSRIELSRLPLTDFPWQGKQRRIKAKTNPNGIFVVGLPPDSRWEISAKHSRIGKGQTTIQPMCGDRILPFVMTQDSLTAASRVPAR